MMYDARLGEREKETLATVPSVMTGIQYLLSSFEIRNIISDTSANE